MAEREYRLQAMVLPLEAIGDGAGLKKGVGDGAAARGSAVAARRRRKRRQRGRRSVEEEERFGFSKRGPAAGLWGKVERREGKMRVEWPTLLEEEEKQGLSRWEGKWSGEQLCRGGSNRK